MDQKRASDLTRFGEPVLPVMSLGRIFVMRKYKANSVCFSYKIQNKFFYVVIFIQAFNAMINAQYITFKGKF